MTWLWSVVMDDEIVASGISTSKEAARDCARHAWWRCLQELHVLSAQAHVMVRSDGYVTLMSERNGVS
jgi:hypothetical protein